MKQMHGVLMSLSLASMAAAMAAVLPVPDNGPALKAATMSIGGRVVAGQDDYAYQWPGVYFESAFDGTSFYFKVGPGDARLHVRLDGEIVQTLTRPLPGLYRVDGLKPGPHQVRIEVASEQQDGAKRFGGIWLAADAKPVALPKRQRQIEFIGDSHTVGYGNTSPARECSNEQIWATTDNTAAFGPAVARHYQADYRISAISGRGIVRNYAGTAGDTLPQAYPYALFDHSAPEAGTEWQPHVVVIALGTNDFSTPLAPVEKWKTREQLRKDYEQSYVAFVQGLRGRYPGARFVLWATDMADGEILSEVGKVVAQLKQAGETRVSLAPVSGLAMTGCNWHPSVADSQAIAAILIKEIDRQQAPWPAVK